MGHFISKEAEAKYKATQTTGPLFIQCGVNLSSQEKFEKLMETPVNKLPPDIRERLYDEHVMVSTEEAVKILAEEANKHAG